MRCAFGICSDWDDNMMEQACTQEGVFTETKKDMRSVIHMIYLQYAYFTTLILNLVLILFVNCLSPEVNTL